MHSNQNQDTAGRKQEDGGGGAVSSSSLGTLICSRWSLRVRMSRGFKEIQRLAVRVRFGHGALTFDLRCCVDLSCFRISIANHTRSIPSRVLVLHARPTTITAYSFQGESTTTTTTTTTSTTSTTTTTTTKQSKPRSPGTKRRSLGRSAVHQCLCVEGSFVEGSLTPSSCHFSQRRKHALPLPF